MNYTTCSTEVLKSMHEGIRFALAVDDKNAADKIPLGQRETYYGVREHGDFRKHRDEIEAELDGRGANYTKIEW